MPVAPELTTATQMYERNQVHLAKAIDGLTPEQWLARPCESSNCALWIVGHMIWARSRGLKLVGFTWTKPWLDLFGRGSKPEDASQYPPTDDVLDAWDDLCSSFPAALEATPRDTLVQPVQTPSPSLDGTIGGMVSFLAMHEAYHVGQVVYVRHWLGTTMQSAKS